MSALLAGLQEEFRDWVWSWEQRGAIVSSYVRPPRFVGDESQHRLGLGVDFATPELYEEISEDAKAQGYVPVQESDHLHVQRFRAGFLGTCGLV